MNLRKIQMIFNTFQKNLEHFRKKSDDFWTRRKFDFFQGKQ